jgi:phosphate/sulfate permease
VDDILLIFGIALTLFFAFMSGFRDGGNLIAANVLSRSVAPQRPFTWQCAGELLGPFVLGSAVAVTLGREVFDRVIPGGTSSACLSLHVCGERNNLEFPDVVGRLACRCNPHPSGRALGWIRRRLRFIGCELVRWAGKGLFGLLVVPIAGFVFSFLIMGFSKMHLPWQRKHKAKDRG